MIKKTIILDTDFLVFCAEQKIDYVSELQRICDFPFSVSIIDKTIEELDRIAARGVRKARTVKLAKTILTKKGVKKIKTTDDLTVDDLIMQVVKRGYVVATQDQGFKRRLRSKKIPIVTVRQKKYLVVN